jgi:parallel beta-helix repeat protein
MKRTRYFFIISLVLVIFLSSYNSSEPYLLTPLSDDDKISKEESLFLVNGNGDLALYASAGNGTPADPYIIFENLTIDGHGYYSDGIQIQHTTAHFIIRNCIVKDMNIGYHGIILDNVTNGIITNCTITNNQYGIQMGYCNSTRIINNTITDNIWGAIYGFHCNNLTIDDNRIFSYYWDGIILYDSYNNSLSRNVGNEFRLDNCHFNHLINNSVDDMGTGFYIVESTNNNLINNTVNRCYNGIRLVSSNDNILIHNTAYQNSNYGLSVEKSQNNSFLNNTVEESGDQGIYLLSSANNTLSHNQVLNNTLYGIYLEFSDSNNVTYNVVIHNFGWLYEEFSSNNIIQGNIYVDYFPIWSSPSISPAESNIYSPSLSLQFNITWNDDFGIDTVILGFNGTSYPVTTHSGNNYYYSLIDLPAGEYQYAWYAKDAWNQWNSTIIYGCNITQATPALQLLLNGTDGNYSAPTGSTINITANLNVPRPLLIYNDTNLLTTAPLSEWIFSNVGVVRIRAIAVGDRNYTGQIVDHYLNLTDQTPPQLVNTSTSPLAPVVYSPETLYQFYALWGDESGIDSVLFEFDKENYTVTTHIGNLYFYGIQDLPVGNYQYTWFARDSWGNWNKGATLWYNVTPASPNLRLFLNGTEGDFTAPEGNIINITVSIDAPTSFNVYNGSSFLTSSMSSYWNFSLGVFQIQVNSSSNQNYTAQTVQYSLNMTDRDLPQVANVVTSPSSPVIYSPGASYQFNATWTDASGIGSVILRFNFTNYLVSTHEGDEYYHTIQDLPAGEYFYRWMASDTLGNWSLSNWYVFVIAPDVPNLQLFLNGTEGNYTAAAGNVINITVTLDSPLALLIYNASELLTSDPSSEWNYTSIGVFRVRALALGNGNYTSVAVDYYLNITDAYVPQVSNIFTSPGSPVEYSPLASYQFNATWVDESGIDTVFLRFNFTNYPVIDSINNEYYYSLFDLPVGDYQYRWLANDTWNNWRLSDWYWFNVSRATPILRLFLNGTEGNYTASTWSLINITVSNNSPLSISVFNNSNFLTNAPISEWNFTHIGVYRIRVLVVGNENYTGGVLDYYLNMTDGYSPQFIGLATDPLAPVAYSPNALYQFNLTLIDESAVDQVILRFADTNYIVSAHDGDEYYFELQDLPAGDYQYRWFANDTFGNLRASRVFWFNVTRATPGHRLYLNNTEGMYRALPGGLINICVTLDSPGPITIFNNSVFLTSEFQSEWLFLNPGAYLITSFAAGNENYTPSIVVAILNMTYDMLPQISNIVNPASPVEYSSGGVYQFNATLTADFGIDTVLFELDGINYTVSSQVGDIYSISFLDLEPGMHQYRWYANDSKNNWVASSYFSLEIQEQTNWLLIILIIVIASVGSVATVFMGIRMRRNAHQFRPPKTKPKPNVCGNHKGVIEGPSYICPSCGVFYCLKCAEERSKQEGTKNCIYCNSPLNYYMIQHQVSQIEDEGGVKPKKATQQKRKVNEEPKEDYYQMKRVELSSKKGKKVILPEQKETMKKEELGEKTIQDFYKIKRDELFEKGKEQKSS